MFMSDAFLTRNSLTSYLPYLLLFQKLEKIHTTFSNIRKFIRKFFTNNLIVYMHYILNSMYVVNTSDSIKYVIKCVLFLLNVYLQ